MPVTASDVARKLGVSRQSVSKVLVGGKTNIRVSDDLAKRIRTVADEMGYRPSMAARMISTGRTGSIDLLMSHLPGSSRLSPAMIRGIHAELARHDMQLTISQLPDLSPGSHAKLPKILRERSADGLLINFTHHVPDAVPQLIDKHQIPAVWLNTKQGRHCVYADEITAYERATQHLLDLGHRKIAFYISSVAGHFSEADRAAGYAAAMGRAGLSPVIYRAEAPEHADPHSDDRQRRARAYLAGPDRPTAIVAYTAIDIVVLSIAAAELGLRLGHELSLVGLGEESTSITGSSLTQVVIRQDELGRAGARRLLRLIESPGDASESSPDRLLEAELFIGRSTGPPVDPS
ncbi:MAG: LacI family DNA-binding transcriptional regulator [Planctomycetota bacterium]